MKITYIQVFIFNFAATVSVPPVEESTVSVPAAQVENQDVTYDVNMERGIPI